MTNTKPDFGNYSDQMADAVDALLNRWPVILALSLVGGVIGFGISLVRPAVYEARTTIGVSISYTLTQPLDLVVEDRVYDRVAGIMLGDSMMDAVLVELPDDLRTARGWEKPADLRASLRLDRKLSAWDLTVTDEDPQIGAMASNLWAQKSMITLQEALDHAWRAASLVVEASSAEEFEPDQIQVDWWGEPIWECQIVPVDIDENLLSEEIQEELRLSRGLFPSLVIEPLQEAVPPASPVLWDRGTIILSGALLGLALAILGVLLRSSPFWRKDELG